MRNEVEVFKSRKGLPHQESKQREACLVGTCILKERSSTTKGDSLLLHTNYLPHSREQMAKTKIILTIEVLASSKEQQREAEPRSGIHVQRCQNQAKG